jgi:tetratricopeptide (TPR) repeat protein
MKKNIILMFFALTLITSCKKDFFQLQRPPESPWNSISEFDRAPRGSYSRLFANGDWGNVFNYWYLYKNAVADDVDWSTPGDNTWGWYRDTQNNKDWLDQMFVINYQVIASMNDALQFVADKGGNPFPDMSSDDKTYNFNRIMGEIYFLRGFAYFMNATTYMNAYVPNGANDAKQVPLRVEPSSSYAVASNSKIGTVKEIWDLILADFTKAHDLLPERYIAGKMYPAYQAGRANKFAAAAMLSRTYFAMGDYPDAQKYASEVIDQSGSDYNLKEDPIEAFNKSTLARGSETIMYIPSYDPVVGTQNLIETTFCHLFLGDPCDWTAIYLDPTVVQRLGWMTDPKNDTTINLAAREDKRFTQLMYVREPGNIPVANQVPGRYYDKRTNMEWRSIICNKAYRGPGIGYTNVPQIRLAEMYLTRSICLFKAGDKVNAANDLNVVRKRAWDADVAGMSYEASARYVTASNITEQMINDERLVEMFCEGDRIDYLRGLKEDVGNGDRGPGAVHYTDKGFVWPVPVTETSLNNGYH